MFSPTPLLVQGRRSGRRLTVLAIALALTASMALFTLPARADSSVRPKDGSFTVTGAGYGHGRGMSQYGAYGAAKSGLTWKQILTFYYPRTTRFLQSSRTTIRVWITADSDDDLRVLPAAGLKLSDTAGHRYVLPTGVAYTAWRVKRSGTGFALSYRTPKGDWVRKSTPLSPTTWSFSNTANIVKVWVEGGARRELRGTVALVKYGTGGRTVNRVNVEDYLRGVVPAEMPTSWHAEAVRAQSVAARSYAARLKASTPAGRGYDLCDTTTCQVYRGYASTSSGRRTVFETERGNAAVKATAQTILRYGTAVALTEFASSNGGSTVGTTLPYQVTKLDPYDGLVASNAWRRELSVSRVAQAHPSAGPIRQLQVTARTGTGRWGGWVTSVKIIGAERTITVTGSAFKSKFGLRSNLFTFSAAGS